MTCWGPVGASGDQLTGDGARGATGIDGDCCSDKGILVAKRVDPLQR